MGIGSIIFYYVGAFIRWMLSGFKGSFSNIKKGPDYDDPIESASYGLITNILGYILLMIFIGLLIFFGC